jgi:hypothetical protein
MPQLQTHRVFRRLRLLKRPRLRSAFSPFNLGQFPGRRCPLSKKLY